MSIILIDNKNNYACICPANYAAKTIGVHKQTISRWKKKAKKESRIREIYNNYEIVFIDEEIKQAARNLNKKY